MKPTVRSEAAGHRRPRRWPDLVPRGLRIAVPSWRAPAAGPAPAETATPLSRDEIAALLHGVLREWPRGRAALTEAERGQARVAGHLRSALYPGWHRKRSG